VIEDLEGFLFGSVRLFGAVTAAVSNFDILCTIALLKLRGLVGAERLPRIYRTASEPASEPALQSQPNAGEGGRVRKGAGQKNSEWGFTDLFDQISSRCAPRSEKLVRCNAQNELNRQHGLLNDRRSPWSFMSAVLRRFQPPAGEPQRPPRPPRPPLSHRPLLLASKGLIHEHAQVFEDFLGLIPHAKKEQSMPPSDFVHLEEIAGDRHCDVAAVFETRHRRVNRECYFWIARVPDGPSVNFFIEDAQSIKDLKLIGNCLKGSRPILQFDPGLEDGGVFSISANLLGRLFSVPFEEPRSKPFVDRTMIFLRVGDSIVMRHYQIQWGEGEALTVLAEVGPRVRLVPHFVLAGAFKGHKLWKNEGFISPYAELKAERREKAAARKRGRERQATREERRLQVPVLTDPNAGLFAE
jgi:ribosome biogenesis protein BRX1